MLVIIPHSTEELKLIKFSKALINDFSKSDSLFYRTIPLWIKLDDSLFLQENNLKNLSKQITSVQLLAPVVTDSQILCPAKIIYNNQFIKTQLPLLQTLDFKITDEISVEITKKIAASDLFPMQLKVFRLGNSQELSSNSQCLKDFVWKKL